MLDREFECNDSAFYILYKDMLDREFECNDSAFYILYKDMLDRDFIRFREPTEYETFHIHKLISQI